MAEKEIYLYRITHIDNIPHIMKYGITHRNSSNANANYIPIGDNSLIEKRTEFQLNNGSNLGDYIPFYFATRTPMLYVIQNGYNRVKPIPAEEIVYCVTSVEEIVKTGLEFIFTDGHAKDSITTQFSKEHVNNIHNFIDIKAIQSGNWKDENDLDLKRRYQAEFLVLGDIPLSSVVGFAVKNQNVKNKIEKLDIPNTIEIAIRGHYYF